MPTSSGSRQMLQRAIGVILSTLALCGLDWGEDTLIFHPLEWLSFKPNSASVGLRRDLLGATEDSEKDVTTALVLA